MVNDSECIIEDRMLLLKLKLANTKKQYTLSFKAHELERVLTLLIHGFAKVWDKETEEIIKMLLS